MELSILARGTTVFDVLGHTSNTLVGGIALHNRQTLKSYLKGAGFRPYAKEWALRTFQRAI